MPLQLKKVPFLLSSGHVALYLETGQNTGYLLEVVNDGIQSTAQEIIMKYQCSQFNLAHAVIVDHEEVITVGTITESDEDLCKEICANIGSPSGPRFMKNRPNCRTWVDNAIHELSRRNVLQVDDGFGPIPEKKTLNIPTHANETE